MSTTYTPRSTQLDRRILRYVANHPGCARTEAGTLGHRYWLPPDDAADFDRQVRALILCGLIRDEGRANRSSLYLTDEGRRALTV